MNNQTVPHQPVMAKEVLEWFGQGQKIIDATLGFGGHTLLLLQKGCEVLGVEADVQTLQYAKESIASAKLDEHFKAVHGNFAKLDEIAQEMKFTEVDGVLFDLGINSFQLDRSGRGLSFRAETEVLDMRLNEIQSVKASDLIAALDKKNLERLFGAVLTKNLARRLAEGISNYKVNRKIELVADLTAVCREVFGRLSDQIMPKVFLALRMAVNEELPNLTTALPKAFDLLKTGGRLVVISFHSTEDRVVKTVFGELVKNQQAANLTDSGLVPQITEIEINPRARSARMRVVEKNA